MEGCFGGSGREGGDAGRVPGHAEAVDVKQPVAGRDLGFGCWARGVDGGIVGEKFWEIVLVDLLAERVCGCCEGVWMVILGRKGSWE